MKPSTCVLTILVIMTNQNLTNCCSNVGAILEPSKLFSMPNMTIENTICNICRCFESMDTIDCFNDNRNKRLLPYWMNRMVDSSYFNGFHRTLECLTIDFDAFSLSLRMDINALAKMKMLKILYLNNIHDLIVMPNLKASRFLKEVTIQNSDLKIIDLEFCLKKNDLQKIVLQNNDFKDLKFVFDECKSLLLLDLSYNRLTSLKKMFNERSKIINLVLDNNQITEIGKNDLENLPDLIELSIAKNAIKFIDDKAFEKLKSLKKLNLFRNNLHNLPTHSVIYGSLRYLNVNENPNLVYFPSADQFSHLKELNVHYSYHCCRFQKKTYKNPSVEIIDKSELNQIDSSDEYSEIEVAKDEEHDGILVNAVSYADDEEDDLVDKIENHNFTNEEDEVIELKCTPDPDPFMPCENLIEDLWLRIAVWIVSLLGIVSNVCAFAYNIMCCILDYYNNNDVSVPTFLLTNLAMGDSLMSIYLLFIALKDSTSRHQFGQSAIIWQRSIGCNLAGFISVLSSLSSALSLAFITFERYYAIRNSLDFNKRITIKIALLVTCIIWIVSLFTASLPLFNINTYSAYAICLPFDTRNKTNNFYIVALSSLLVLCFLFICICYGLIFISTVIFNRKRSSLNSCNNKSQLKMRHAEDQKLIKNISLLVLVNTICWGPVVFFSCYALITMLPINRRYLKYLAIFFIPFNSLINPFLYCISKRSFRQYLKNNFLNKISRRSIDSRPRGSYTQTTNIRNRSFSSASSSRSITTHA